MARRANILADDNRGTLTIDLSSPDLRDCKKKDLSFFLQSAGNDEVAVFRAMKDREVVRENVSRPFPRGSFTVGSQDLRSGAFVVHMKKKGNIELSDIF